MVSSLWTILATSTLAVVGTAAAQAPEEFGNFTYNYTVPAYGHPIVLPSGGGMDTWIWDYIPDEDGDGLRCGRINCSNSFVEFQYGGTGFCLTGTLKPTMRVRVNPEYSEVGIVDSAGSFETDGHQLCVELDPGFKRIRVFGAMAVKNVTFQIVSNLPAGMTVGDLKPKTYPLVKDGKPTTDAIFSWPDTVPAISELERGTTTVNLAPKDGKLHVNTPKNAAFMVVNGARAQFFTDLQITENVPLPLPISGSDIQTGLRASVYEDTELAILPLDPALRYDLTLSSGSGSGNSGSDVLGVNLTSITFYEFPESEAANITTPATSTSGTVTSASAKAESSKSSSNAGAIAGGIIGALLGVLLIISIVWVLLRRRRLRNEENDEKSEDLPSDNTNIVVPFVTSHTGTSAKERANFTTSYSQSSTSLSPQPVADRFQRAAWADQDYRNTPMSPTSTQSGDTSEMYGSTPMLTASSIGPRHGDIRPESDDDELLPPMYNPNWNPKA